MIRGQSTLKKKDNRWVFETKCDEKKKLAPLRFDSMEIYFDGKKVNDLTIDFYASGEVLPLGTLLSSTTPIERSGKSPNSFLATAEQSSALSPAD